MLYQVCRIFKIAALLFLVSFPSFAFEEPQETVTISGSSTIYLISPIGSDIKDYILSRDPTNVKQLYLFSLGGKIRDALAIAEYVRKNNIEIYVGRDGKCYSACTIIFQAGSKRFAHETAKFMYHYAFNREGEESETLVINETWTKIMFDTLIRYGIHKDLIDRIKPDSYLYLTAEEAMRYNIVTTIVID